MNKFNKSQMLRLSIIATLLVIAPLLSPSLRPTYIYFVVNLLIIAVGAEAGLLSFFSKPADHDKEYAIVVAPRPVIAPEISPVKEETANTTTRVVEKCSSEKIVGLVKVHNNKVKKCPSMPSLFFIGSGEKDAEELVEDDEEEEVEGLYNGQELFHKAETFIGNFYKQLKMQREDSWKKIHGLYHKAF